MARDPDRLRPPKAGQPIRSAYLKQEHLALRRAGIVPIPPLFTQPTDGGIAIGIKQSGFIVALATSTITAATKDGDDFEAYGSGTADLYKALADGGASAADGAGVGVQSVAASTIASGSVVLLAELPNLGPGLFVLGKVC